MTVALSIVAIVVSVSTLLIMILIYCLTTQTHETQRTFSFDRMVALMESLCTTNKEANISQRLDIVEEKIGQITAEQTNNHDRLTQLESEHLALLGDRDRVMQHLLTRST